MAIKRKELDKIYQEVKSKYRRINRDKDIIEGIEILYQALIHYVDRT